MMVAEILKDIRDMLVRATGLNIDISKYYAANEDYWRLLIPDEAAEGSRFKYTEIVCCYIPEIFAEWSHQVFRNICLNETPKPEEERDTNVRARIFIILYEKSDKPVRSRRIGNDIYLFFNLNKLTRTQIKFYLFKILGRLFLKRSEKIVEATRRKIGRDPYGVLADIVEFFKEIGQKMFSLYKKFINAIRFRNATNSNNAINSKYYNSNNTITNSPQNTNTRSSLSKELEFARMLLNAQPVLPEQPKRIVI